MTHIALCPPLAPQHERVRDLATRPSCLRGGLDLLDSDGSLTEAVLVLGVHGLQVAHAAGASGAPPLRLLAPVVRALAGRGVAARRASLLLDVVGATAAASAKGVGLARALSETRGTFRLRFIVLVLPSRRHRSHHRHMRTRSTYHFKRSLVSTEFTNCGPGGRMTMGVLHNAVAVDRVSYAKSGEN